MNQWKRPKAPEPSLLKLLHRVPKDSEAGVTFAHEPSMNGERQRWTPLCTIPRAELDRWFPALVAELEADSYFSINSFIVPKRRGKGRECGHPDFPNAAAPMSRKKYAQHINACYVDLDTYKINGLDQEAAFAQVLRLSRDGKIPHPSLLLDSGRGLWCLWLLRDNRKPKQSPPAFATLQAKAQHINNALNLRMRATGSDRQATDISRFIRVPGSRNTKTENKRRVGYWIHRDENEQIFTYTLDELSLALGISKAESSPAVKLLREADPNRVELGQRGALGRWLKEFQRFNILRELRKARGGPVFTKGQRSRALRYAAGILVAVQTRAAAVLKRGGTLSEEAQLIAAMSKREVRAYLEEVRSDCELLADDLITSGHVQSALAHARSEGGFGHGPNNMTHQTIADWFQITPEEAAQLPATTNGAFPCRSGADPIAPLVRALPRLERTHTRRELLRKLIEQKGTIPSLREIRAALQPFGAEAAPCTIQTDLEALGLVNPRSRQARKRRSELLEAAARPLFPDTEGRKP